MNIKAIRSDAIYREMTRVSEAQREELYRYTLMKPFEFKWQCVGVPLRAETAGGYDVVAAAAMSGLYTPAQITEERLGEIERISDDAFWNACEASIRDTLDCFVRCGVQPKVEDYVFTVLLGDPQNPMSAMTGDYCGDGGIPGYILGTIIPNDTSLQMLPVALAHEANHNVRWQFMQWSPSVTLADMIVSEGLAENCTAAMFGTDKVGKWVRETSAETLETLIKPAIKANLDETDFAKLSSFLYGDEIMALRGGVQTGMPYCAGYACGYWLIRHYLDKTGRTVFEATVQNTADILAAAEDFWL